MEIGIARSEVFICERPDVPASGQSRPAADRDQNCQDYLLRKVELIQPNVICTLGNFSTKLLRGDPTGITRAARAAGGDRAGPRAVRLYPIYHPAAALYTPRMLETLREDFMRLPELLALGAPEQRQPPEVPEMAARGHRGAQRRRGAGRSDERAAQVDQLGLF